ncbi:M14 family zinc carboxypeptidase [Halobacteriovorax sp. HLS]|uniref:M14 family zinc carboxypeptidase n=1 Tax=Halobacteriovorax sp. HLS TaxID=2234000 RepID=UPI0013E312BD|nr:M14 family zinc carboxypeptidase [Halobacteriovorax sp. HLS]
MKKILLCLFITQSLYAVCVHETKISGVNLLSTFQTMDLDNTYYQQSDGSYQQLKDIKVISPSTIYHLQKNQPQIKKDYDDRYVQYYRYERIQTYIEEKKEILEQLGYVVEIVGKSIQGRSLYSIYPKEIEEKKKTILMFGRHHGDEGTANWIIEGFLNNFLSDSSANNSFQLILYPMVNPDGAENRVRYNKRGRDLNRVWDVSSSRSKDEVGQIHTHLNRIFLNDHKPIIALDMHGSFTEDFIYRVKKSFKGEEFFNTQQSFIDTLGRFDRFQDGNFQLSNGHHKMARIMLVREFGINALTHETQRDISLSANRSIQDLKQQGLDVLESIKALY